MVLEYSSICQTWFRPALLVCGFGLMLTEIEPVYGSGLKVGVEGLEPILEDGLEEEIIGS